MAATIRENEELASIQAALALFDDLGGDDFVAEMVDLLNHQTPQQFTAIEKALTADDIVTVQRHAHSMKSSFGNFGATTCQELATNMDHAGKNGDAAEFVIWFERIKLEFARLQSMITRVRNP